MSDDSTTTLVRAMREADVPAAATVVAHDRSVRPDEQAALYRRVLERGPEHGMLWVAEAREGIVGVARAAKFEAPTGAPDNVVPNGWYLMGVVVAPSHRRCAVGRRLTAARLDWISERAEEAWCFTGSDNTASMRLHEAFGFVQVTTDFWFPTLSFESGSGVLYRWRVATRA
jgi:ribosomal protein S18 acetylase RimI-like enzyme